jgi:hypothetical protein
LVLIYFDTAKLKLRKNRVSLRVHRIGDRGLASLRDLPDLARLEDAGLLGKAPLPEELRGALGIRDDDEDGAESAADEDSEGDQEYAGVHHKSGIRIATTTIDVAATP